MQSEARQPRLGLLAAVQSPLCAAVPARLPRRHLLHHQPLAQALALKLCRPDRALDLQCGC